MILILFLLSFSFVSVIFYLMGSKKPAFFRLFTQMTTNFVEQVFTKLDREFCQSLKMCYFQVANDLLGHLASKVLISQNLRADF